ncbi:MAG: DUF4859 domain-containing protein [Bacteroidaceae bacterium]|nr:DUF4859 domain-containing protein [Bacteroidaceae bacterium]MBQ7968168.1 DUF4859 domain-containing protein [Bacteroidaceae bacterium]
MKHFTLKIKQLFAAMMLFACIPASAQFKATVEQYANSDYSSVAAEFKLTEVATALETDTATLAAALNAWYNYDEESGAEKPADMFFLKSGEELIADYSTNAPGGFWMSGDCRNVGYTEEAVFFEDIWFDSADDFFGLYFGQMPDTLAAGATFTPSFVLKHGEKQVTFDITYTVKPLPTMPEAELEIAKLEIVGETEVTVDQTPSMSWKAYVASVSLAGVAEKFGVDAEIFPTMIPNQLYQAKIDLTYGLKVDSLIAITVNDGWGRVAMSLEGDTLTEVCSANYGSLEDLKAFYTNGWSFDAATDTLSCNMGQFPERMVAGDQLYSYVYLVYGNKAFRIKYILNVIEDPNAGKNNLEDMTKVGSSTFSLEQYPTTDYSTTYISLNADSIATLLGCSTSDMVLQAIDNNGALSTNSTATKGGYWMTQGGIICGWGDNAYFFVEPNVQGDYSQLNFGQMPGNTAIGEEGHTMLYLTANGNYYELDITLKIVAKEIVGLESFENVATRNLTIQQEYITYEWSKAASIPMEQIYSLIGTTEPVLYGLAVDSVAATTGSKYTDDYTCTPFPGFWLNAEGRNDKWGSSTFTWGMSAAVEVSDEAYNINCMLDHGAIGDVYNGQFFLANLENQKMITINLTYQIVETLVEFEVVGEEWINLPVSTDDASVDYDLTKVATAFGLESVDALFEGYYVKGLKADGTYTEGLDAINSGVIFTTSGAADTYGDIGVGFSEDYKQIWTYSNVDLGAPFKAEATFCFEIDSKRYIIHATLLDPESYAAGIEGISADKKDGKIYNLQGQEVVAPAKGIYIMNGKKFLVK